MKKLLFILVFLAPALACSQALPIKNVDPKSAVISKQEAYWIYTLRTRFWTDGTKIVVFYREFDSSVHADFCRNILGVTPSQFAASTEAYINVGTAAYFRRVESEAEMYRQVERTPGAVGYLSDSLMLINGGGYVRKVFISG